MSLVRPGRQNMIDSVLAKVAIVLMTGTRLRAPATEHSPNVVLQRRSRWIGATLPAWPASDVVKCWNPEPSLEGRGGACRVRRANTVFTGVCAYFPPHVVCVAGQRSHKQVVDKLFRWLEDVAREVRTGSSRSLLVVDFDLNDEWHSGGYATRGCSRYGPHLFPGFALVPD